MRNPIPFLLITLLLATSCSNKGTSKNEDQNVVGSSSEILQAIPFLTFERTPCFGECPAFRVVVDNAGNATYEGIQFADPMGKHTGAFTDGVTMNVFTEAERIGFFEMKDKYDSQITDIPAMIIRIQSNGRDKKIYARDGIPKELKDFGKYLDTLVKSVDWEPVPNKD